MKNPLPNPDLLLFRIYRLPPEPIYGLRAKHPNRAYITGLPNPRLPHISPTLQTPEYIIYSLPAKLTIRAYIASNPKLSELELGVLTASDISNMPVFCGLIVVD